MSEITRDSAEALFASLADALSNAEATIIEIIRTRAWEPLGYATFAQAWDDRLKGVRLATGAMKANVVYAMLEDGMTEGNIIEALGMNDDLVAHLSRQRSNGVPADSASTVVRRHLRSRPSAPRLLHIHFETGELERLKALAKSQGFDLEDEARRAIRSRFAEMMKVGS